MEKNVLLLLGLFLLSFSACKKTPEHKYPATLSLSWAVDDMTFRGQGGTFYFEQLDLNLLAIAIEGQLEDGPSVAFERSMEQGSLGVYPLGAWNDLDFDLPKGRYTSLRVSLKLAPTDTQALFLQGMFDYNNPNFTDCDFNFSLSEGETLAFHLENFDFHENKALTLRFNIPHWMSGLNGSLMQAGSAEFTGNGNLMRINRSSNAVIYGKIKDKLAEEAAFTVLY